MIVTKVRHGEGEVIALPSSSNVKTRTSGTGTHNNNILLSCKINAAIGFRLHIPGQYQESKSELSLSRKHKSIKVV